MASNAQDLSSAHDEILRDSGGPFLNNNDFLLLEALDNANLDKWPQTFEEDGNLDTTSSFPVQTSTHQAASDVVDKYAPNTSATSSFNTPFINNDPLDNTIFDEWLQRFEEDGNFDPTSSFPAHTSTHQEALDVVDKYAPGTSATSSFITPFMNNRKVLSEENSSPPPAGDSEAPGAVNAAGAYGPTSLGPSTPNKRNNRKVLSEENSSPPPAGDSEAPGAVNAAGAYGPTSLGPSTPKKRKRSDKEEADSLLAPKTRKRQVRNSSLHHFPQLGSPSMIVDGQPCYVAEVPVPAGVPSGSKTTVAADGLFNFNSSERYLDSNRMRQMVKNGLADTVGIHEGDKWECRLPGGTYLIECLRDRLCSMQWFGEVVFV